MRSQYYTDNPVADADNYWYDKDKEWEDTLKEYRKCDICGESLGYGDTVYDIFLDRSVVICEECKDRARSSSENYRRGDL